MTAQSRGKASPAMNNVLRGRKTKYRQVPAKALASICANSEPVSNEIDGSDLQFEKHSEQRI
jgi:hypothetical protein